MARKLTPEETTQLRAYFKRCNPEPGTPEWHARTEELRQEFLRERADTEQLEAQVVRDLHPETRQLSDADFQHLMSQIRHPQERYILSDEEGRAAIVNRFLKERGIGPTGAAAERGKPGNDEQERDLDDVGGSGLPGSLRWFWR